MSSCHHARNRTMPIAPFDRPFLTSVRKNYLVWEQSGIELMHLCLCMLSSNPIVSLARVSLDAKGNALISSAFVTMPLCGAGSQKVLCSSSAE